MTRDTSMISTENSPPRSLELHFDPPKKPSQLSTIVRSLARSLDPPGYFRPDRFAFAAINGLYPTLFYSTLAK